MIYDYGQKIVCPRVTLHLLHISAYLFECMIKSLDLLTSVLCS